MTPLAERMRPKQLEDYLGQEHLIGKRSVLRLSIESGNIPSMILWGPPGVGKTTLANIIAHRLKRPFYTLSAISSGVKDVRDVIEKATEHRNQLFSMQGSAILFIDEIHRFSKSQQDSLLGAVERGIISLIGATTENPSFEIISPLLSRCQVYILKPLEEKQLIQLLEKAVSEDEQLKKKKIFLKETDALIHYSGGDVRKLFNLLEITVNTFTNNEQHTITNECVTSVAQTTVALYDKAGDQHYDMISAFIKSMRGSDPNAAVYWLARMVKAGEDPEFIARRMLILASEDIGNANPLALVVANNCFEAVKKTGYPECRIILSQTAIYLATSAKSNAAYTAIENALSLVNSTGDLPVPLHLRNAPTQLMKNIGYGNDYKYAHGYEDNFINLEYLPSKISGDTLYDPGDNESENKVRDRLKKLWKEKYKY